MNELVQETVQPAADKPADEHTFERQVRTGQGQPGVVGTETKEDAQAPQEG